MTVRELKKAIRQDPVNWRVPLMDFVDDFRRRKNAADLADPGSSLDERLEGLVAAVVESLCRDARLDPPAWTASVPACRDPWFVSGLENLKAIAVVESPLPFRLRKIFVLEDFLHRV